MKILDYLKLAIENFRRKKFRTIVNIIAIAIGVILIVTLLSLSNSSTAYVQHKISEISDLKQLTVNNTEYQTSKQLQSNITKTDKNGNVDVNSIFKHKDINKNTIAEIQKQQGVTELLKKYSLDINDISCNGKKYKDCNIAYYDGKSYLDAEYNSLVSNSKREKIYIPIKYITAGRNINANDKDAVLVPETIVKNTFGFSKPYQAIGKKMNLSLIIPNYNKDKILNEEVTIVGVIDERFYQESVLVSKDVIVKFKNFNDNTNLKFEDMSIDSLQISTNTVNDADNLVNYVENTLHYSTENVQTVAKATNKVLYIIKIGLSIIGLIVIFMASLDIVNTMNMSVNESTKSIGIMRATGASKLDILFLFLVESMFIGLLGGLVGVGISKMFIYVIKNILGSYLISAKFTNIDFLNQIILMDNAVAIKTIFFTTIITMIAGLYPSIRASKYNPIDALGHE